MKDQEVEIWHRFQKGDKKAFETILETYYLPMFQYGSYIQPNSDQLYDEIHNLFLNLWERRSFLSPVENLKAYLFTALRNQILRSQRKVLKLSETRLDNTKHTAYCGSVEDNIIGIEITKEKSKRVKIALNKLTKREKEALHLRFFENYTNSQIATVLGISEASVYNLVSKALRNFRQNWLVYALLIPLLTLLK